MNYTVNMSNNRNLASIANLKEAESAWERFFGRFFSSEIPPGVGVEFDPLLREFKPRENKKAKNLSPFKNEGRTDHSDDFDDFLNGNTVKIPESIVLDKDTLNKIKIFISNGDFSSDIFKKIDHIYYALWLFKQNQITRQQMSTILAVWQVNSQVENNQGFKIIDGLGNFTPYAINILIPVMKKNSFHGKITEEQLERFRLLLMAAPRSEQIFYLSDPIKDLLVKENVKQLGGALKKNLAWYRIEHEGQSKDLHLSFGTMESLQIAISGITWCSCKS